MKITYKTYTLEAGDGGIMPPNLYDLYEQREVEKKDRSGTHTKNQLMGYGYTLARAIGVIAASEANKKGDVVGLDEYIKFLKEESKIIKKQLET